MNGYARLADVRNLLNGQGTTAQDGDIVRAIEEASAFARTAAGGRNFHSETATRYFSGEGCRELWVGDLVSVTTLKISATLDQPSTFEYTLTAGTDYTLWPRNAAAEGKPYRKVILNPNGQYGAFPAGVDNVQLVGVFGWPVLSDQVVVSGSAVTGTLSSDSDLTITASVSVANDVVQVGDTLILESEQVEVTVVSTTTITVVRGINGTTAAGHSSVAMYIRRYRPDIERAVGADASRHLWRASQGFPESGSFREMWPSIAATLASYTDPAAVL